MMGSNRKKWKKGGLKNTLKEMGKDNIDIIGYKCAGYFYRECKEV
jgi:hypothetical protein